ncbi:hypothetical protein V6N13_115337 [Hibiscus sabdariffa]
MRFTGMTISRKKKNEIVGYQTQAWKKKNEIVGFLPHSHMKNASKSRARSSTYKSIYSSFSGLVDFVLEIPAAIGGQMASEKKPTDVLVNASLLGGAWALGTQLYGNGDKVTVTQSIVTIILICMN